MSNDSAQPSPAPPSRPTIVTYVGGLLGFVLLLIGSIAVLGNSVAFLIGASRPGTGAMAENIRSTDMTAAGIACSVSFVILWLPGFYLFTRARRRFKAYAAHTGSTGRSPTAQLALWGLLAALVALLALIVWYFK